MKVNVYRRRGKWGIRYREKGEDRRRIVGTEAEARAEAVKVAMVLQDARHFDLLAEAAAPQKREADPWALWEAFRAHMKANARASETIRAYTARVPKVLSHLDAKSLDDLTPEAVDRYKGERLAQGAAHASINAEVKALVTMLRWAVVYKKIKANPLAGVRHLPTKKKNPKRALSESEITALLDESPERYRRVWTVFLGTGLRRTELVQLRWKDVDLERRLIHIRPETSKTRAEAWQPFGDDVAEALGAPGEPEGHVFVNGRGRFWGDQLLPKLKLCCRHAGIDLRGVCLHSLRYTFATRLIASGADIKTVQSLMRHATAAMTLALYAQVTESNVAAAVAGMRVVPSPQEVARSIPPVGTKPAPDAAQGAEVRAG